MKLILMIKMDEADFKPTNGTDAARILCELADELRGEELQSGWNHEITDNKGNAVGEARITGMDIPDKPATPDLDALYLKKDPVFQTGKKPTRLRNTPTFDDVAGFTNVSIRRLLESLAKHFSSKELGVAWNTEIASAFRNEKENWK